MTDPSAFPPPARHRWMSLAVVASGLLLWELASRRGMMSTLFFPPPSTIARTLIRLGVNDGLLSHVGATLTRVALGLLIGGVSGLLLGWLMGWSLHVRVLLDPFIAAVHPLPKIAVFPLVLIVLGLGDSSKIAVVALGTFFPIVINTMAGVRQILPVYFEVAESCGVGRLATLTRVVIPGSLPMVLAGVRIALNTALLITIATELIAADRGLGAMMWLARETLRVEELYAALVVTALLGMLFNSLLRRLTTWLTPWHVERTA